MRLTEEELKSRRSSVAVGFMVFVVPTRRAAIDHQWRTLVGVVGGLVITHLASELFGEAYIDCADAMAWLASASLCVCCSMRTNKDDGDAEEDGLASGRFK